MLGDTLGLLIRGLISLMPLGGRNAISQEINVIFRLERHICDLLKTAIRPDLILRKWTC